MLAYMECMFKKNSVELKRPTIYTEVYYPTSVVMHRMTTVYTHEPRPTGVASLINLFSYLRAILIGFAANNIG